jgi:hypothetical protein
MRLTFGQSIVEGSSSRQDFLDLYAIRSIQSIELLIEL